MENKTDFNDLVRKIDSKEILLPDFQRDFVWKDEDQQKSITASVLAKMPIGSILLLQSEPTEYACKKIGLNQEIDTSEIKNKIYFLLDGQQRITVLTNVFSNEIQDNKKKISDLVSPSLKRHFFLLIPRWKDIWNDPEKDDLFGVKTLRFPYLNPDSDIPDFLSGDIKSFIVSLQYSQKDIKPYNPSAPLSTELDDFCLTYQDGYLIPLFLAIGIGKNQSVAQLRYTEIIKSIAHKIKNEIMNYYEGVLTNENLKIGFIEQLFPDEEERNEVINDRNALKEKLANRETLWPVNMSDYIKSCLKEMVLNQVIVSEKERKRAIDIYENMNRGGVTLNTFDLIMAKVAIVSKDRFYDRIISLILSLKTDYPLDVVPSLIDQIIKQDIQNNSLNCSLACDCYNDNKKEISPQYLDAFLDVLSLYCNNPDYESEKYNVNDIKKNSILNLSPEEINNNTEKICSSLDRALFFFQTRCGIRSIKELNNSLMLVIVGTIFTNDEWFNSKRVHRILEAWYWAALFSGEFDKDQNAAMIRDLQNLIKIIKDSSQGIKWLRSMQDLVLKQTNFSDEDLLLMRKVDEDRYPKRNLRAAICQFLLSRSYTDMFDSEKIISVFGQDADSLEAHHIIPLGTVNTYGESTRKLRDNPGNICNSPLNFVLITKEANKAISDDPLNVYIQKITPAAKSALHITDYNAGADISKILEARYTLLLGDIQGRINNLLVGIETF